MFEDISDLYDYLAKSTKTPKVSTIMMSFLGDYPGARSNPIPKFHRAIKSFLNQSYENTELIIVSDGCELTNAEYENHWSDNPKIQLIKTDKNKYAWPGTKRQIGIDASTGSWIAYLDTDDIWHPDHLSGFVSNIEIGVQAILNQGYAELRSINTSYSFKNFRIKHGKKMIMDLRNRWVYVDNIEEEIVDDQSSFTIEDQTYFYKFVDAKFPTMFGSSRTFHRKDIPVKWSDRNARGEDVMFSNEIQRRLKFKVIDQGTYIVCHRPFNSHLNSKLDL